MGKIYRAYRFRIYPTPEQEQQMARTFGCCRFIYNQMLADKIREYKEKGKMTAKRSEMIISDRYSV